MDTYLILLFWSLISASIFFFKKGDAINGIYLCLNFIPMILVSGMRASSVGTDTKANHYLFSEFQNVPLAFSLYSDDHLEMGYVLLNKIIGIFSNDSQLFIFFISLITLIGFAYFFFKYSTCVWISTFLFIGMFFFCETLNTMRQCIATMILCCAYLHLLNNEKIKYICFVLIASSIHFSAIIFIFFVLFIPITKKKFCLSVLLLFSIFAIMNGIIYWGGLELLLQFDFSGKYGGGYGTSQYALPKEIGVGIYRAIVFIGVIIICLYLDYKERYNAFEKKNVYLLSIFLLCATLATLAQYQMLIFYRYIFYFAIYTCLIIPLMINKIGFLKFPVCFVMFIGIFFFLSRMLYGNGDTKALFYYMFL